MAGEAELRLREQLSRLRSLPLLRGAKLSGELERLQKQLDRIVSEPSDEEIWRSVELARHPDRPYTLDYVERLFDDWFELHGDHHHGDDAALVAGLGRFRGRTIVLLGNQKGRDVKERTRRNFGMAYPEGYGKAMRAMELAGQTRAAEERQAAEAVQPLAQLNLGFTRHCRRAAGGARRSP